MIQQDVYRMRPHRLVRRKDMVIVMAQDAPAGRARRKALRRAGFASRLLLAVRRAVRPVLDGLGRLGIAPWDLFQFAAHAGEFLLHRAAGLWRAKDKSAGEVRILWILRITEIEVTAQQPAPSLRAAYRLPDSAIEVSGGPGRSMC